MTNGLVVMTPTTVNKTGGSSTATINADGSVTFSACETIGVNGIFTADYDNYMVTLRVSSDSSANVFYTKVRSSGTDASSNYAWQRLVATSTTIVGERQTGQTGGWRSGWWVVSPKSGYTSYFFGPYLAQPTAFRIVGAPGEDGARVEDYAGTHSTASSYDGFSLIHATPSPFSGLLTVFGFNQ